MAALSGNPVGKLGMGGQMRFYRRASGTIEAIVDERLQIVLADGKFVARHFTLRSSVARPVSRIDRSLCRPRDSRDITVPDGTPSTRAASS